MDIGRVAKASMDRFVEQERAANGYSSSVVSPSDGTELHSTIHSNQIAKPRLIWYLCNPKHDNNYCFDLNPNQCSDELDANNNPFGTTLPLDTEDCSP